MFDHLICNGRIVDGTGVPWFRGDVGIDGSRIAAVGDLQSASAGHVLDARGGIIAPGFIDAHVHSDIVLLESGDGEPSIRQGVTTHIIGQDGVSYAPLTPANRPFLRRYFAAINGGETLSFEWASVAEFLAGFNGVSPLNVAYLVPHGTVRAAVMGLEARDPTRKEIVAMQRLIERGLEEGAIGVSTGLDYLPCLYAATDELVDIAHPAAGGGVFVTHMRSYTDKAEGAIRETIEVGRRASLPVHISHFNCRAGMLTEIDRGREQGIDVTFDAYPYLAGSTVLMLALPREVHAGTVEEMVARLREPTGAGRLEAWTKNPPFPLDSLVLANLQRPDHQRYLGENLVAAAELAQQPLPEFVHQLLLEEEMAVGVVVFQSWRTEEDMIEIMNHPGHMVGSDGIYVGGRPHPRGWGAFARLLGHYVRERGVLTLEEMIRHMTSVPAARFGLSDRGLVKPGMAADIVVFDDARITDRATFENGRQLADGVSAVFVNGEPVLDGGGMTGARPGQVLP